MPIPNYLGSRGGFRPLAKGVGENAPILPGGTAPVDPGFYDPNTGVWVGNPAYGGGGGGPAPDFGSGGGGPPGTSPADPSGGQVYLPPDWNPTPSAPGTPDPSAGGTNPPYGQGGGGGGSGETSPTPAGPQVWIPPSPSQPPSPRGPTYSGPPPAQGPVAENPRPGSSRVPPPYQGLPSWTVTGTGTTPPETGGTGTGSTPNPPPTYGGPTYTGPPPQQRPPSGLQTWGGIPRPSPQPAPAPSPAPAPPPSLAPTPLRPVTPPSSSGSSGSIAMGIPQQPFVAGIPGPLNYNFQPISDTPSAPMGGIPNYAGMANYGFNPQAQNRGQGQMGQPSNVPNYNGGYFSQGLNAAGVNSPNWLRAALSLGGL